MKNLTQHAGWVLILAGVLWGYMGLTKTDLVAQIFGGLDTIIYIILAIVALLMGYQVISKKK